MSREDILLKEYEVCQQDSSSIISTQWTVATIFFGIITLLLGWVVNILTNRTGSVSGDFKWIVTVLGVAVIGIVIWLCLWQNRISFLVGINHFRMHEIERELGMRRGLIVKYVDNSEEWAKLSCKDKKYLGELRKRSRPHLHGAVLVKLVLALLGFSWLCLILYVQFVMK